MNDGSETKPAAPGFKDHFSALATGYAAHRPTYPAALVDFLAGLVPTRHLVWDCGCGSGQLSMLLARAFDRVIATDASRDQIASALPNDKIEYRCAPAEKSGLPDGSADLITVAQAAHWFDLPAFYEEARRVGRAGAAIALLTYGIAEIAPDIDGVTGAFYRIVLDGYWPAERVHVEEGYRSLPFPFAEIVAPEFEIRVEWRLEDLTGYIKTWSAVGALRKAQGDEPLQRHFADLAEIWGPPSSRRTVRWPLALRIGHIRERMDRI